MVAEKMYPRTSLGLPLLLRYCYPPWNINHTADLNFRIPTAGIQGILRRSRCKQMWLKSFLNVLSAIGLSSPFPEYIMTLDRWLPPYCKRHAKNWPSVSQG